MNFRGGKYSYLSTRSFFYSLNTVFICKTEDETHYKSALPEHSPWSEYTVQLIPMETLGNEMGLNYANPENETTKSANFITIM